MGSLGSLGDAGDKDRQKVQDFLDNEGKQKKGKAKPLDIDKMKDKSLEGVERKIRNLTREQLYVFDENDNLVQGYQGNKDSVAFPSTVLDMKDATVTHGHPKGMAEFGGTFSFADVNNMLKSQWKEHRATASGQGEMNYIMRRTEKSNPSGLRDQINKDYKKLQDKIAREYTKAYKKAVKEGNGNPQHIARQAAVGALNAYYKKTMPKYGYEYITRKKDYKYNR